MTLSYDYWKDREEKARQQTIKDEEERIKEIEEIYKRMFDEIQRDIDEFFAKYAADEGITIAEAKKRVSKLDMEEFERKAKEYVKNKDFSDQANEEMKLYNLTMKVNRLEMLKAKIGLELVDGYQEIEDYMGEALTETTMKEIERHAGILGKTVGDNQDYAEDIVDASFHNATWSERIWANQDRLKHDLGKLLTSGLIQGKNPRELARDLQKSMNVSKYDAERLMRTEMCRVQIDASLREIEANGFTQFIFIADSGGSRTCEQCKALDGKTFALKDGKIGVNLPPIHPNCRCSIAGHEDDEDFISWLENHGVELTDDDLEAMGLSRGDPSYLKAVLPKGYKDERNNIGDPMSEMDLKVFLDKANELGIRVGLDYSPNGGFENYCGDIKRLHTILEHLAARKEWLRKNNLDDEVVLMYDYVKDSVGRIDPDAFAMTQGKIITLNKFMYDDPVYSEKIYSDLEKDGFFTKGSTIDNVIDHEMGHVFCNKDKKAQQRVLDAVVEYASDQGVIIETPEELQQYIESTISVYATPVEADGDFNEVVSELTAMMNGSYNEIAKKIFEKAGYRI